MTDDLKKNIELRIYSLHQWHIDLANARRRKDPLKTDQALSFIRILSSELRHFFNMIQKAKN